MIHWKVVVVVVFCFPVRPSVIIISAIFAIFIATLSSGSKLMSLSWFMRMRNFIWFPYHHQFIYLFPGFVQQDLLNVKASFLISLNEWGMSKEWLTDFLDGWLVGWFEGALDYLFTLIPLRSVPLESVLFKERRNRARTKMTDDPGTMIIMNNYISDTNSILYLAEQLLAGLWAPQCSFTSPPVESLKLIRQPGRQDCQTDCYK